MRMLSRYKLSKVGGIVTSAFVVSALAGYKMFNSIHPAVAMSHGDNLSSDRMVQIVDKVSNSVVTVGQMLGAGSGFVVDKIGLIITNFHVVGKFSSAVRIKLSNGTSTFGEVLAVDKSLDLALIKIDNSKLDLEPLKIANRSSLRVGQTVLAFGSPVNLINTVTHGIISGLDRDIGMKKNMYIQTDAILTFGSSGGPLIDEEGFVVGVNVSMVSTGFGFAIPCNEVKKFLNLAKGAAGPEATDAKVGYTSSGDSRVNFIQSDPLVDFGLILGNLTIFQREEFERFHPDYTIQPSEGLVVHWIIENSSAEKYGLKRADIIVEIFSEPVKSMEQLVQLLSTNKKSSKSIVVPSIKLVRAGKFVTLKNLQFESAV